MKKTKNPAAVSLGRLGGLKGGKVRAKELDAGERARISSRGGKARSASLTAAQRKAQAKKAAEARWNRKPRAD